MKRVLGIHDGHNAAAALIEQGNVSSKGARLEEARIRAAYAKRQDDKIRYSCFIPGQLFLLQERERQFINLLQRYGFGSLREKKILEVGCGTGCWLRDFIKWGAQPKNLTGVDLLFDLISEARQLCLSPVNLPCASGAELPFGNETFDLVLQSTVFTSVLDPCMKKQIASEMVRVVKRDGLIMWYDYHINNPWNSDVRGVKKGEITKLFPNCRVRLRRITLAPPLARRIAARSWLLASLLERIPLLCTHYLGVIEKRG